MNLIPDLASARVTLNGVPAIISRNLGEHVKDRYVQVTALDSGVSFIWSLPAADRILASGGMFQS